jgi:hypothetical protein
VSHTSTGWLVRSVALSVRFIDKVAQFTTVFARARAVRADMTQT